MGEPDPDAGLPALGGLYIGIYKTWVVIPCFLESKDLFVHRVKPEAV